MVGLEKAVEVLLAPGPALVELVDVGEHDVRAEKGSRRGALHAAERREREIFRADRAPWWNQAAIEKHLALVEVVPEPVAHDQVRAEDEEALHAVGEAQPHHRRRDQRRLAAARDDVLEEAALPEVAPRHLARVDRAQKRLPLM